ncbi:LYAR-type C2HC zinc finger [Necator americanus]|uniref:LYAR-type C2HC zinc finger n=1 Tax=Necator americanus TaxID=51031 RepID=W2T7U5_NECAM|nr:LYAR-type C2HC zinc finger [Necator americanus]ETN77236.1 LYAR-type C2HC zinc finger [Necator americanus]
MFYPLQSGGVRVALSERESNAAHVFMDLKRFCIEVLNPQNYQLHIKCISENQKYGSKNYVEKEAKGEMKQNAWCEQVERAVECVKDPKLKSLLQNIQGYNNIPRKEAKFINFLTNSCRIRDSALCKMAWKAIANEAEKLKKEKEEREAKEMEEKQAPTSESGKQDENGNMQPNGNDDSSPAVNFKWKATIKRKLREAGGEMKIKKLRKTVLSAYREAAGDNDGAEELFEAKLAKSGVSVNGKLASIAS